MHTAEGGCATTGRTRIKPPGDVIKLADRLHYVLQPSLESLLAEGSLAFPVQPFPFQFEGVAFLYPRQAAILADEMGLGKTMQAITAMRLLLRRGEVRSVLLVCPKPLVTNWQRELARWAPEVPVMVVEGDQAKRQWQWSLQRRAAAHRQLRTATPRSRSAAATCISIWSCSTSRSGSRTGRVPPAKSVRSISRRRELGTDRHAGREQRRGPGGHFRVPGPGLPLARHEAAQNGPERPRLRAPPHQGPGAHGPAAEAGRTTSRSNWPPSSVKAIGWPRRRASCG